MTGVTLAEPASPSRTRAARFPRFGLSAALVFAATQAFALFTLSVKSEVVSAAPAAFRNFRR